MRGLDHPPQTYPPPLAAAAACNRRRRRPDLTLPVPQRDPCLAVPLPLPPPSAPPSSSAANPNPNHRIVLIEFSHLDRICRIGSGAGGTVYKVVHRPTASIYALKVIHGNHEDSVRRQIRREIQILRDVDHPNIVRCHDMFEHAGEIQVLLEYMDGGSLEGTHVQDEKELAAICRQILSALSYLHRRKIVHRDIKPSNLLINSLKQVKIADFGVSRILSQTTGSCNSSVGTIAYMSPERINPDLNDGKYGKYDGFAGDIWSFGVTILEFYLGQFPFSVARQQGDWASLVCAICMAHPPVAPPSASSEFRDFIACCLQRDPRGRWGATQLLRHPFVAQLGNIHQQINNTYNHSQQHHMLPPPPHSV